MAQLRQSRSVTIAYSRLVAYALMVTILGCIPSYVLASASAQIHGFVSQAYIKTNANNFFGKSTGTGSTQFRELGINGSMRPLRGLQTSAQVLYRQAGDYEHVSVPSGFSIPGNVVLDFALMDYQFYSTKALNAGLRLGRVKNPFGLFNDTRDVAVARPGVILPQSVYFDRVRDFALSSDGVHLYSSYVHGRHELQFQGGLAIPRVTSNLETTVFSMDLPGRFLARPSAIARVLLDLFNGQVRLGYSDVRLFLDYEASDIETTENASFSFKPKIFSIQVNSERLILTSEYAIRGLYFVNLSPFNNQVGESFYLEGRFLVSGTLSAFLRYDLAYLNVDDKSGQLISAATSGARPAHSQYAKDVTAGIKWRIGRSWSVMAEQHYVLGTAWLPVHDNPVPAETQREWWMFNFLVSYNFR